MGYKGFSPWLVYNLFSTQHSLCHPSEQSPKGRWPCWPVTKQSLSITKYIPTSVGKEPFPKNSSFLSAPEIDTFLHPHIHSKICPEFPKQIVPRSHKRRTPYGSLPHCCRNGPRVGSESGWAVSEVANISHCCLQSATKRCCPTQAMGLGDWSR